MHGHTPSQLNPKVFLMASRFHEPRFIGCSTLVEVFSNGSTPASKVMAVTGEAYSLLAKEMMTASPGFKSAPLR